MTITSLPQDTVLPARERPQNIAELGLRESATFDRATIADPNVTSAAVWEFVCENWEPVGRTTVKEHRNRVCSCYRAAA